MKHGAVNFRSRKKISEVQTDHMILSTCSAPICAFISATLPVQTFPPCFHPYRRGPSYAAELKTNTTSNVLGP